jgi:S-adenosylmethionine hydrolase
VKSTTARLILTATLLSTLLSCTTKPIWFPVVVVRISKEYANINTNITEPQLAAHGIRHGTKFNVRFKDRTMEAFLGNKYSDVAKGDWVALIEEDGKLQIAISYGHAATDIACAEGDTLYIESRTQVSLTTN